MSKNLKTGECLWHIAWNGRVMFFLFFLEILDFIVILAVPDATGRKHIAIGRKPLAVIAS